MPAPPLVRVPLDAGVDAALEALPRAAGVAQIVGADGRSLLVGRAADLRKWAATQLGRGRPRRKGARPPVDLSAIAGAVLFAEARAPFRQRLLYERVIGEHVPLRLRRDLKVPAWLHLDPEEPFPRLTVRAGGDPARLYGPFRDARAASRARDALQRATGLRPCDYVFTPAPDLALGLACVYAQVETCLAPCLARTSAADYRALAQRLAGLLADPAERSGAVGDAVPAWIRLAGARAVIVEPEADALVLYPLLAGALCEERAVRAAADGVEAAVSGIDWSAPAAARDDTPWLMAWRHGPRRGGLEVVLGAAASDTDGARVRSALSPPRREAQEGAPGAVIR